MFCLIPLVFVQYVLAVNSMDFVASILILINRQYHEFSEGKYTNLFPEGIWNCLFPEGSKALKQISCYKSLKEINCILLIRTIRFIIYKKNFMLLKPWKIFILTKKWSLAFVYIRRIFPSCDVIMISFWGFPLKTHDKQWLYHESRW